MIVAINLETGKSTNVSWNIYSAPFDAETVYDLISGRRISLVRASGGRRSLMLSGGQMFCLCKDRKELERVIELEARDRFLPEKIERQEAAAMAFRAIAAKNNSIISCGEDSVSAAESILRSPGTVPARSLRPTVWKRRSPTGSGPPMPNAQSCFRRGIFCW